jgi:hypothetical protein
VDGLQPKSYAIPQPNQPVVIEFTKAHPLVVNGDQHAFKAINDELKRTCECFGRRSMDQPRALPAPSPARSWANVAVRFVNVGPSVNYQ